MTSKHSLWASSAIFFAFAWGCTATDSIPTGKHDTSAAQTGLYRYVIAVDEASDRSLLAGSHNIAAPFNELKSERIDGDNLPELLHPALKKATYQRYDPNLVKGETSWRVFPSQWWSMGNNGIAKRYAGGSKNYADVDDTGNLSPVEKYDLLFHPNQPQQLAGVTHWTHDEMLKPESQRGPRHSHPATSVIGPATLWELKHHGVYQAFSHPNKDWWGHCNGWSSYATTEPEGAPKRNIWVRHRNPWQEDRFAPPPKEADLVECLPNESGCVFFRMADIEALLTELYFADTATMAGKRCESSPSTMDRDRYGRPKDPSCRDLNPGAFHIAITGLLGKGASHLNTKRPGRPSFVIDYAADVQVWNFPVVKYEITHQEELSRTQAAKLLGADDYVFNDAAQRFIQIELSFWLAKDNATDEQMLLNAFERSMAPHRVNVSYVLELGDHDSIVGGEWLDLSSALVGGVNSQKLHPDFLWIGQSHVGYGEGENDTQGDHDNPHINYRYVRALLACSNDPSSCASGEGNRPSSGGQSNSPNAGSCQSNCGNGPVGTGEGKCYCDATCVGFGDCCDDYKKTCEN